MGRTGMNITFWTTLDCNLNCAYCYNRANNNIKKDYMTSTIIEQGIKLITGLPQFNSNENMTINFHGGEPLMNCDAIEHIMSELEKIIPRDNITYGLTTNGTLSSDKHRKVLKKIDEVSVSIDGDKKNHNKYRVYINGRGSYDEVIKFAKELQKDTDIRVRATITTETLPNMSKTVISLIKEGFKEIIPALDMFDQRWKDVEEEIVFREFRKIKKHINENDVGDVFVGWVTKSVLKPKGYCTGGVKSFHILPNGDIYPCTLVVGEEKWIIGKTSEGLDYQKINQIQEYNSKITTSCSGCNFYKYCNSSRCKLINKRITGDFFKASAITCLESRVALEMMETIS
jgi:uncharacterized protein